MTRPWLIWGLPACLLLGGLGLVLRPGLAQDSAAVPRVGAIDFNQQIRPILSENCFQCHGPDEQERKAKLRLDTRDGALSKLRRGGHAIVAGKPADSHVLQRILSDDPSEQMPPPKTTKKLTPEKINLLKRWIEQGAAYAEHWAFVAPKRPLLPKSPRQDWARNGIDHFILARLEKEGLSPSPEADPVTLIRRLTLDLTGLPPTPAEVDAFLRECANAKPQAAYLNLVDRLMNSQHYGERMAVDWLDAARFADTHGYHIDSGRDMTRWREWVIDAFNTNLPFDRFTIEQLAGDLLPNASLSQKVASGFNRNHMINFEGGAIPDEYHNAYVVDRVNTTGTVWLGLTLTCAQCHDHKYDPISQKEFYQLYAFFYNVPENGLDGSKGNAAPTVLAPSKSQRQLLEELDRKIKELEGRLNAPDAKLDADQAAWERTALADNLVIWRLLEPTLLHAQGGATFEKLPGFSILVKGNNPANDLYTIEAPVSVPRITALKVEALPHESFAGNGPGRSVNGNVVLTNVRLAIDGKPVTWRQASADFSQQGFPVSNAIDANPQTGWAIHPEMSKAHAAIFSLAPTPLADKAKVTVNLDFRSPHGQHQLGHFRLSVTDAEKPHGKESMPANVAAILRVSADKRTDAQKAELRTYYRQHMGDAGSELARLRQAKQQVEKGFTTAMVMQDGMPRDTFVRVRGEYSKKGEKVKAGVPSFLPPLDKDVPVNRLALAKWLVSPEQPLTSRVIVNRYWQMFFGTGLVKSVEDFGSQSDAPSHPELLDWLAVEFQQPSAAPLGSGAKQAWSVKDLVRMIVTSSTYRQASIVTKEHLAKDAENRLLGRSPRLRLQAEFIRDQALAVSGLLNREIGGASVNPYQPVGLWKELSERADSGNWTAQFFVLSKGQDLYRRTMYTFWKRTSPPPQLLTFDAPDRETCTVRRGRTNTPLQALILMNDPTYVEASRKLAERLMHEAKTTDERIALAFRMATARQPQEREASVLRGVYEKQLARYQANPEAALKLLTVGESPRDERLPAVEVAAWSIVASVILNLDETVTKN